jgi:hypothetical protein
VDGRADLFSLGCVLYVLCTGEIPFKAETTLGTLMALALNTPVAPDQRNELVPAELSQLIMQLLEKDPAQRPKSAHEVIGRLTALEPSFAGRNADTATMGQTLLGVSKPMSAVASPVSLPVRRSIGRGLKIATGLLIAGLIAGLMFIAAEIFLWPTPDGRIVRIECNDPSIKLAFRGGELKVTGAYDQPVTLTPGKVDLKISKPQPDGKDFVFESDKLVVRKGDLIVLKIEVLDGVVRIVRDGKGLVDSKSLPFDMPLESIADIDRAATMWFLSVGAMVAIEMLADDGNIIDDTYREIHRIVEIPKEPFAVKDVYFPKNAALDDAGFVNFRDLKNLQMLVIDGAFERITDAAIENLRGCTRLGQGCGISDKALEHLKHLPALTYLSIGGKPGLTDAGLVTLKKFPALTTLYIGGANLTDAGLRHFSDFRNLQSLGLGGIRGFTDEGLAHVAEMKTLKILDLVATNAGDATVKRLSENPNLTDLSISYTQVTDEGFAHLQAIKGLKVIWVRDTRVTANAIESFRAAVPECRIEYGFDNPLVPNATDRQE